MLHSGYFHSTLRSWQSSSGSINKQSFIYPVFVSWQDDSWEPIDTMPGQIRVGVNRLEELLHPLLDLGLSTVLLFGIPNPKDKNYCGHMCDKDDAPVPKAIKKINQLFNSTPGKEQLLIACDVCLCAYTDHGHCGILKEDGYVDNDSSVERLCSMAVCFARAGAHIIAPSDMMDGRVKHIKEALAKVSHRVALMSYSAKFASSLYGPFRDAASCAPSSGDRRSYQLPLRSAGLAMRAVERDVNEGADIVMVKPGIPYLDIVRQIRNQFPHHPIAIYHVSGEFKMLYDSYGNDSEQLRSVAIELFACMERAGANIIISYLTPIVLQWLKEDPLLFSKTL